MIAHLRRATWHRTSACVRQPQPDGQLAREEAASPAHHPPPAGSRVAPGGRPAHEAAEAPRAERARGEVLERAAHLGDCDQRARRDPAAAAVVLALRTAAASAAGEAASCAAACARRIDGLLRRSSGSTGTVAMPGTTSARPVATAAEVCAVAKVTETVADVIRGGVQRSRRAPRRGRAQWRSRPMKPCSIPCPGGSALVRRRSTSARAAAVRRRTACPPATARAAAARRRPRSAPRRSPRRAASPPASGPRHRRR